MHLPVTEHVLRTARHRTFYLACGAQHVFGDGQVHRRAS